MLHHVCRLNYSIMNNNHVKLSLVCKAVTLNLNNIASFHLISFLQSQDFVFTIDFQIINNSVNLRSIDTYNFPKKFSHTFTRAHYYRKFLHHHLQSPVNS